MNEKLLETVKVETFIRRMRCPNAQCEGYLESDDRTRTENSLHGGPVEYRHKCSGCTLGAWLKEKFPKLEYKVVPVEGAPTATLSASKKSVKTKGENVVQPTASTE